MCEIIAAKKPEDFQVLKTLLTTNNSINPKWRLRAVSALGSWGDASVEDKMIRMLDTKDERLKCNLINSLGALRTEKGLAQIERFLHDDSLSVRKAVIYALAKNKSQTAIQKLKAMENDDPSNEIRELAKLYLGHEKEKPQESKEGS